jgi:hypothetical protein
MEIIKRTIETVQRINTFLKLTLFIEITNRIVEIIVRASKNLCVVIPIMIAKQKDEKKNIRNLLECLSNSSLIRSIIIDTIIATIRKRYIVGYL